MKEKRPAAWFMLLCCLFFPQALVCGQDHTVPAVLPNPQSEEDLVHYGDVIDVDIVGGFEFDWRGTLTPDGFLDGIDGFNEPVYGLCRSEAEISAGIAKAFSKILRDPKVIVRIIDRSNRAVVRLAGAVKTPTRFTVKRPVRLTELLVQAGGLTDDVSGEIAVFRPQNLNCLISILPATAKADRTPVPPRDNRSRTMNIKISDLLKGDPAANIPILSGDMIDVSRATPVYVIGAVNSPRPIYSRANITVSRAVASAGGLAKDADGGKVTIFRKEGLETKLIEADLAKIKLGVTDDIILASFDIIDVASKGGGKRKFPPVAANGTKGNRDGRELPLRVIE